MSYCVQWQESYAIDHPVIDEQHQMLFQLANRGFYIAEERLGFQPLQDLFAELFEYTAKHFRDEEVIWLSLGEEICQRHKIRHIQLKKSLEEIWREDTIFTTSDTVYRLHGWIQELLEHIMLSDRSMYQQLLLLPQADQLDHSSFPS